MEITRFDKDTVRKFWEANLADCKGKVVSPWVIRLSRRHIGKRILDAGAGDGSLARNLSRRLRNAVVEAIDIAPKSESVKFGDITSLKFDSESFDTVFCADVLEHLNDDDLNKAISEISRVLTAGGKAIITTLNSEDLRQFTVMCPQCGCIFHRQGHQQSFTIERLNELFARHEFRLVEHREVNFNTLAKYKLIGWVFYALGLQRFLPQRFKRDLYAVFVKLPEKGINSK